MELALNNGFQEMSFDETVVVDGGFNPLQVLSGVGQILGGVTLAGFAVNLGAATPELTVASGPLAPLTCGACVTAVIGLAVGAGQYIHSGIADLYYGFAY